MDLDHLDLRVRDPAACRDFYERHLGFRPAFEAEGGYFVRNDHGFLLALAPAPTHRPLPDGVHIGFRQHDVAELTALRSTLAAAGVPATLVEDERPGSDYVTFRCQDPDGTEIEIWDGS